MTKTQQVQTGQKTRVEKAAGCTHAGIVSCATPLYEQLDTFLQQAELLCRQRQQRFTALRKQVLSLVCQAEQPIGAYALMDLMKVGGRSAAPPTVYRALDFLQQQGFVHRLASNNTYLACAHPERPHEAVFLVCRQCGHTRELHTDGIFRAVSRQAGKAGFQAEHAAVEVSGLCAGCMDKQKTGAN